MPFRGAAVLLVSSSGGAGETAGFDLALAHTSANLEGLQTSLRNFFQLLPVQMIPFGFMVPVGFISVVGHDL